MAATAIMRRTAVRGMSSSVTALKLKPLPTSLAEAKQLFKFWHEREIEYRDLDAMNHVNHAAYFTFFETLRVKSWSEATGVQLQFEPKGIKPVLGGVWCSYRRPLALYDTVHVGLRVENVQLQRGQFEHRYIVWSEQQGTVAAEGGADVVMCNFSDGGKRCPIPSVWIEPFM